MKKILLIFILLLAVTVTAAQAQAETEETQNIKLKCGINSNKLYIKTKIKGHQITIKSPKISKNKYLKLVNVAL